MGNNLPVSPTPKETEMPDFEMDYDATAPVAKKVAIRIQATGDRPPGQGFIVGHPEYGGRAAGRQVADFMPGRAKARQMHGVELPKRKTRLPPVIEPGGDYIPREEMNKRNAAREARIKVVALEIYRSKKKAIIDYTNAVKLLKKGTGSVAEVDRAEKIVKRGHPMTRQRAVDLAREQVMAELRR